MNELEIAVDVLLDSRDSQLLVWALEILECRIQAQPRFPNLHRSDFSVSRSYTSGRGCSRSGTVPNMWWMYSESRFYSRSSFGESIDVYRGNRSRSRQGGTNRSKARSVSRAAMGSQANSYSLSSRGKGDDSLSV